MPAKAILTPIALKLHSFGLQCVNDPNWCGQDLYYHVKDCLGGREDPTNLLRKTLTNGLLFQIGRWLMQDYFIHDWHRTEIGDEHRLWYLEDLIEVLKSAGVSPSDALLLEATQHVEYCDGLYSSDEQAYWSSLAEDTTGALTEGLIVANEQALLSLFDAYAENYAERVFHDRQLCEHIGRTLVTIGFDGTVDDSDTPIQWCDTPSSWRTWAVKAVVARDRGLCATCGANLTLELEAVAHIDHIVPLAGAGTNDLSNLQLLCDACNLTKSANIVDVLSSVPPYLQLAKKKNKQPLTIKAAQAKRRKK